MDVMPTFRPIDLNPVPKDWALRPMLSVVTVASGQVDPKAEPYRSMILVAPDHIASGSGRLLKKETAEYQHAISGKYLFAKGDIVYSKIRPYLKKAILANFDGLCSADMYPLKPAAGVSAGFVFAVILGHDFSKYAESVSVRSGMPKINRDELAEYTIAIPVTQSEQEAIAKTLGDADALIESLERLLAKKRHIKQGTMQKLLTGKKHLPGFSGKWEAKTLQEICWFQEGPGVRTTQFTSSGMKLLNGTNIFRGILNLDSTSRFISHHEASGPYAHFLADAGDIVIASSGITIERFQDKVAIVRERDLPFCMNTSTIRFKPFDGILAPGFLFHFLTSDTFKRAIGGQATGSAQLNFGPSHVAKVNLPLPQYSEQIAVAEILSDMNTEIVMLEHKLAKVCSIKQSMMHELLTGRIRLL